MQEKKKTCTTFKCNGLYNKIKQKLIFNVNFSFYSFRFISFSVRKLSLPRIPLTKCKHDKNAMLWLYMENMRTSVSNNQRDNDRWQRERFCAKENIYCAGTTLTTLHNQFRELCGNPY